MAKSIKKFGKDDSERTMRKMHLAKLEEEETEQEMEDYDLDDESPALEEHDGSEDWSD